MGGTFIGCAHMIDGCQILMFSAASGSVIQASSGTTGGGEGDLIPTLRVAQGTSMDDFMIRPEGVFSVSCMQVCQPHSVGVLKRCYLYSGETSRGHMGIPGHASRAWGLPI